VRVRARAWDDRRVAPVTTLASAAAAERPETASAVASNGSSAPSPTTEPVAARGPASRLAPAAAAPVSGPRSTPMAADADRPSLQGGREGVAAIASSGGAIYPPAEDAAVPPAGRARTRPGGKGARVTRLALARGSADREGPGALPRSDVPGAAAQAQAGTPALRPAAAPGHHASPLDVPSGPRGLKRWLLVLLGAFMIAALLADGF